MISFHQRWLIFSKYLSSFYLFWILLGYILGLLNTLLTVFVIVPLVILIYKRSSVVIILVILSTFCFGFIRQSSIAEKVGVIRQNVDDLLLQKPNLTGKIIGEKSASESGYKYLAKLEHKDGKELGYLEFETARYPKFKHGDIVELQGYFRKPTNLEKSTFDYVVYLERKEIFLTGSVRQVKKISETNTFGDKFLRFTYDLKQALTKKVSANLPEPHASLLSGILFGERSALPEDFSNQLRFTGTTHVVAISGYNMTIIIEFVKKYGRKFFGKASDYIAGGFVVWFGVMTGMSPPVERAVVSSLLGITCKKVGMKLGNAPAIVNSALIMLLIDPRLLHSISFLLSFAAVMGLIYWVPVLKSIITFIPESLEEGSLVTLAALIATIPVSLYFFGTFSLLALPTNFLIGPLVGLIMSLGFVALFAGLWDFISSVFDWLFYLSWIPLDLFIAIVKFAYDFKFLYFDFTKLNLEGIRFLVLFIVLIQIVILFLYSPIKKEALPRFL